MFKTAVIGRRSEFEHEKKSECLTVKAFGVVPWCVCDVVISNVQSFEEIDVYIYIHIPCLHEHLYKHLGKIVLFHFRPEAPYPTTLCVVSRHLTSLYVCKFHERYHPPPPPHPPWLQVQLRHTLLYHRPCVQVLWTLSSPHKCNYEARGRSIDHVKPGEPPSLGYIYIYLCVYFSKIS